MSRPPALAITCGDPAGIGPEIVLRAVVEPRVVRSARLVVLGPVRVLRQTARALGQAFPFVVADRLPPPSRPWTRPRLVDVPVPGGALPAGRPSVAGGRAALGAVEAAVGLCQAGAAAGVVTAPVSKEGLALAGVAEPGHTELLQRLTGSARVAMLYWSRRLQVVLLTTHLPLREALRKVRRGPIRDSLLFVDGECRRWFGKTPRIAVAGLNPHAGEAGLLGHEEQREIVPAVRDAREAGVDAAGPFSPDTLFVRAARGEFDLVFSLYHDQGTIAIKSLAFGKIVNTTLGLPFSRTSVDHGTAYDIAGRGVAEHGSLVQAILLGARLARRSALAGPAVRPG